MSDHEFAGKKVIKLKPINTWAEQSVTDEEHSQELGGLEKKLQEARSELDNLLKKKEEIIRSVRAEIEMDRESWKTEKKQWTEQAKEEGFQSGFLDGKEAGFKQYQAMIDQINSMEEEALKQYHTTIEKSDMSILELAVQVAEKIVNSTLQEEPQAFIPIVKEAIKELKEQPSVSLYLHPVNYESVLKQKHELEAILIEDTQLSIYMKEDLKENDCLIKYPFGQIDAGVDTQLQEIRAVLNEVALESKE
ncbi:flagellar assembly protein FliH [Virgibacillus sediminis]|uniref:Flagellar assembly protein FliH n=1 Tax=Virgibacillus sediminis TaxID=202260 RepID=A0ABV7AAN7_9BACI